ncbi:uncharacterized protein BYT42DRAFT_586086 [Radiomyces spectabilis]|uniref:uncharacterized protein n=1 Tax=Radiomyces spectabilis TaxID=64574 RepID=UPI0022203046|nr:uncharacterized protein BYT42DRAFT_586086 [Radiomyces spectabilis]KAI8368303.1 hypothetical protein BYT42DRAFT_586086 [Radiomyces spectabilis]
MLDPNAPSSSQPTTEITAQSTRSSHSYTVPMTLSSSALVHSSENPESLDLNSSMSTPLAPMMHEAPKRVTHVRQLFVGNLPFRVRWQDLKDLFRKAGNVIRTDVALSYDNRSKGHGTVLFATVEEAQHAIDILHNYKWQGRVLEVREDRGFVESGLPLSMHPPPQEHLFSSSASNHHRLYGYKEPTVNVARQLFVGNLPFHCQWQDVKDLFRNAGNILRADVAQGPDGRSRGFGTVLFATHDSAKKAIAMYDKYEFHGRQLRVHFDKFAPPSASSLQYTSMLPNMSMYPTYDQAALDNLKEIYMRMPPQPTTITTPSSAVPAPPSATAFLPPPPLSSYPRTDDTRFSLDPSSIDLFSPSPYLMASADMRRSAYALTSNAENMSAFPRDSSSFAAPFPSLGMTGASSTLNKDESNRPSSSSLFGYTSQSAAPSLHHQDFGLESQYFWGSNPTLSSGSYGNSEARKIKRKDDDDLSPLTNSMDMMGLSDGSAGLTSAAVDGRGVWDSLNNFGV